MHRQKPAWPRRWKDVVGSHHRPTISRHASRPASASSHSMIPSSSPPGGGQGHTRCRKSRYCETRCSPTTTTVAKGAAGIGAIPPPPTPPLGNLNPGPCCQALVRSLWQVLRDGFEQTWRAPKTTRCPSSLPHSKGALTMRGEVKKKGDAQPRQSMMLKKSAPGPKKKINLSVYPGFSGDDGAGRPILRHHRHASSTGRSWTRRWQMATRERGSSRRLAAREGRPGRPAFTCARSAGHPSIADVTSETNSGLTARAPEQRSAWLGGRGTRHGSL